MKSEDVAAAIVAGEMDDALNEIVRAVKSRRERIAVDMVLTLKAGDKVRLTGLSPKWLNGQRGEVLRVDVKRGGKLKVQVDVPALQGTRYDPQPWLGPRNVRLDKVDAQLKEAAAELGIDLA